jgi:hypothetical protein
MENSPRERDHKREDDKGFYGNPPESEAHVGSIGPLSQTALAQL